MDNLTDAERSNIEMAIELMFIVAEFNSIEQDVGKILIFKKYGKNCETVEALNYIKKLTGGDFKYSEKIGILEKYINDDGLDVDIEVFRSLGRSRNMLLHAIYFLDNDKETIKDEILLRKIERGSFSEESKKFDDLSKQCRTAIREIGDSYDLTTEDESIKL